MQDKPTKTITGPKAKEAIVKGVRAIADVVKLTLGPAGANAVLPRTYNRGPRITNDGVTISEITEPKDPFENLIANTFKEAAKRTNQLAGDGSTSTAVVAEQIVIDSFAQSGETIPTVKGTGSKSNVMALRNQILEISQIVQKKIKERAQTVETLEDLKRIALIAVEDPDLGNLVAEMVWDVGTDGFVDIVEGFKGTVEHEVIKGMRFPAKVAAKAFVNNPAKYEMVAEDVNVIVTNFKLDNAATVVGFLSNIKTNKVLILAPSFSEAVLISLHASAKQSGFFSFPVAVPSLRTEQFEDIAVYTGATFINKDKGMKLERIGEVDMGSLDRIVVKDTEAKEDAVAIGGKGTKETTTKVGQDEFLQKPKIEEYIDTLKKQILETREPQFKKLLERRIASLASAIGVIRVGAPSNAESLYKKLKIEDAVYACKAALEEGYVKGGGLCLLEIAEELPESIVTAALKAPYNQIQKNAGGSLRISEDVIDPAKVVRCEVEHAFSVAAHLLTVEIIIVEVDDQAPGEGYQAIADALKMYTLLWGKQNGLLTASELEAHKDMMQQYETDVMMDS